MSFEAKFRGVCHDCDEEIHVGQTIARLADGKGYVHVACPDTPTEVFGKICTRCWQAKAKNGSCACE